MIFQIKNFPFNHARLKRFIGIVLVLACKIKSIGWVTCWFLLKSMAHKKLESVSSSIIRKAVHDFWVTINGFPVGLDVATEDRKI